MNGMKKHSEKKELSIKRCRRAKAISLYDLDWKLIRNYHSEHACARHLKVTHGAIHGAIKRRGILLKQYRVGYVKKERPDIGKAKRI